ncbi:hypothetical protein TNCV_4819301 [Trichonephila clavipes]|nr:hypothetical protein TNCV_4819301 [Trichonephila clavipes]
MAAVDFLHHENPPIWAGVELATLATRGLWARDHVILKYGQVTWTTPELAPPSPNYPTTPTPSFEVQSSEEDEHFSSKRMTTSLQRG